MERLTPSARKRSRLRAALSLLLPILLCLPGGPWAVDRARAARKGDAAARAKAFMRVAVQGRETERTRAALLWGLYACDARAPAGRPRRLRPAHPAGGLARLAARRLEDALAATCPPLPVVGSGRARPLARRR